MAASIQFLPCSSFKQRCELERAEWIVATLISVYRELRQKIDRLGRRIIDVATLEPQEGPALWSVRAVVGPKYHIWC